MLSKETRKLIERTSYRNNYPMRALATYYKNGANTHPDHNMKEHFIVFDGQYDDQTSYFEYIQLANANGTLAVYRRTKREELRRLKRWPQSVEDGTAMSRPKISKWLETWAIQATTKQATPEGDDLDDLLRELGRAA